MVGKDYGDRPNSEFEKRFPDLVRARNLVIKLFQSPAPLAALGYGSYINQVMNVLSIATEPGEVITNIKNYPYLYIEQETRAGHDSLQMSYLPSKTGFELEAFQEKGGRGFGAEALLKDIMSMDSRDNIFKESPALLAYIGLFYSSVDLEDLNFLVSDLKGGFLYTDPPLGLKRKNPITNLAKEMGLAATYHAAWLDEKRKQEFVVVVEFPKKEHLEPAFIGYKKLPPLVDAKGKIIPIGKRPNLSKDLVMRVLNRSRVFSGQLVLGN